MDRDKLTEIDQLRLHVENDLSPPCLDTLLHEIDGLAAEIARLKAENEEARELLKPLARHADVFERNMGNDMKEVDPTTHMVAMGIWVADCQRARAFLKEKSNG